MVSTPPKTPILMYHMLIKDSFMIHVIKCCPLLPENFLLGIFRQLLGSEAINIESWKFNWDCTITVQINSRSLRSILFFLSGFKKENLTGGPIWPPPTRLGLKNPNTSIRWKSGTNTTILPGHLVVWFWLFIGNYAHFALLLLHFQKRFIYNC